MKNNIFLKLFARGTRLITTLMVAIIVISVFYSCDSDKISEDNLYTFKGQTIGQYLTDSAKFSEFTRLLDTTNVLGLLKAYGTYTCFIPTNEAMEAFYKLKGKKQLSDFSKDSLKIIAYDHIIINYSLKNSEFVAGRQSQLTMSDRYISISYEGDLTYVNKTSRIIDRDVELHNGVIQVIDQVLNPTRDGIVEAIAQNKNFSLFYNALIATGLADSLLKAKDASYESSAYEYLITVPKEKNDWFYQIIPPARKFGYTVLMESNETMQTNGITDIESMKRYAAQIYDDIYPDDANISDVTDRRNSLNRFIAYHLINKQLSYFKFINAYDTGHMLKNRDMFEYLEPMCPNTLIEVKKDRTSGTTNILNYLSTTGKWVNIVKSNSDNDATNGVYHEIDNMLVYSRDVDDMLSTKRLRFDLASFFPELTNNDFRGSRYIQNTNSDYYNEQSVNVLLPQGYVDRIKASDQTTVCYLPGYHKFQDYQGDEMFLSSTSYDFAITTPTVPAGTYEVRFGYLTNGKRGVAQFYFDGVPCGVPVNMNTDASDASIGWINPGSDSSDPNGFENDKMMRNRGYMKGPACYKVLTQGWSIGENARYSSASLRKILGQFKFTTAGTHILTVKGLSGGEFMLDYMEFVPTSILDSEDIY